MGVLQSVQTGLRHKPAFTGRADAREFHALLAVFAAGFVLSAHASAHAVGSYSPGQGALRPDAPVLIWCCLGAGLLLAAGVRRLHDTGMAPIRVVPALVPFLLLSAFVTSLLGVGGFGAGAAIAPLLPVLVLWVAGLLILFSFSARAPATGGCTGDAA